MSLAKIHAKLGLFSRYLPKHHGLQQHTLTWIVSKPSTAQQKRKQSLLICRQFEMRDLQMHRFAIGSKIYNRLRLPDFLYLISLTKDQFLRCPLYAEGKFMLVDLLPKRGTEVYCRGFNRIRARKSNMAGVGSR